MSHEEAKGIPSRKRFKSPVDLPKGKLIDYIVQRHVARKAGPHYDVRFGTPKTGLLSWATRKELPKPGERPIMLFEQPTHSFKYKNFEGTIPMGYGAGTVKKHDVGKAIILEANKDKIKLVLAHKGEPEEYTLIKATNTLGKPHWLVVNSTPTKPSQVTKEHYKKIHSDNVEKIIKDPNYVMSNKIDGAAALVKFVKDKIQVLSYRTSKEDKPIIHTHRVGLSTEKVNVPDELKDVTLRGEIYGTRNGKSIPAAELGGLLNSSVAKSLTTQEQKNINLRIALFGVANKGETSSFTLPFEQRKKILNKALAILPKNKFHAPDYAYSERDKRKMWNRISSGEDKLTTEGIVGLPLKGGTPVKVKISPEAKVYIREIFPAEGKYKDVAAGGFRYSNTSNGEIVGKVGTGFNDELRKDMHSNPNKYIGRLARIHAQEKFPSGAYRAPSFIALHEDYSPIMKKAIMHLLAKI